MVSVLEVELESDAVFSDILVLSVFVFPLHAAKKYIPESKRLPIISFFILLHV